MTDIEMNPHEEQEIINEEPFYQPDFFSAHSEYLKLVDELISLDYTEVNMMQKITQQIIQLLEPFQAYSQLLDVYLDSLTRGIFDKMQNDLISSYETNSDPEHFSKLTEKQYYLSKIIYTLMKVRGWKTIVKLMPHSVHLLEPILHNLIQFHPPKPSTQWESKYVLMIWLSFVLMNPFDLKKLDSGNANKSQGSQSLVDLVYNYSNDCFKLNGKPSEGAIILLSRLLIRKDVMDTLFPHFFQRCQSFIPSNFRKSYGSEAMESTCLLRTLIYILKFGNRTDFIKYQNELYQLVDASAPNSVTFNLDGLNPLTRKHVIKLIQRIGLAFLKPTNSSRKPIRGLRSLGLYSDTHSSTNARVEETEDDSDLAIPPEIEPLLGLLIESLGDPETIVRWSTSKAVGRITQRLSKAMHLEIAQAILDAMDDPTLEPSGDQKDWSSVNDTMWHGSCLALAEMARRGLLASELLPQTLDKVLNALTFEQKRGSRIIGGNVRDAACFCLWSFARAYLPDTFQPFSTAISRSLIVCALFDRELQVRRASSAAFQELVGRLGIFDHGIKLVGLVDYFSVGNISRSYLRIGYDVALLPEYRDSLVEYLVKIGCVHWDAEIRALSSGLLNKIVKLDPDHILDYSLPKLIQYIQPPRISWIYHGGLLGVSSLLSGWITSQTHSLTSDAKLTSTLDITYQKIVNIITNLPPSDFTDFGTDLILEGACQFIQNLSASKWPISLDHLTKWYEIVCQGLERSEANIQVSALAALKELSQSYPMGQEQLKIFVEKIDFVLNGNSEPYLEGWILSFGEIQYQEGYILDQIGVIRQKLEKIVRDEKSTIEFRKNALVAINKILLQLINNHHFKYIDSWDQLIILLIDMMNDYTLDNRGDVGSWLRQETFVGSQHLLNYLEQRATSTDVHNIDQSQLNTLVANILQQSVEKIDKLRQYAGELLQQYTQSNLNFDGKSDFKQFFNNHEEIEWTSPKLLFPIVIPLMLSKCLMPNMMRGLVTSTGTSMENLSLNANEAFLTQLLDLPIISEDNEVSRLDIANTLMNLIQERGRLVSPSLITLHSILEGGGLSDLTEEIEQFYSLLIDELLHIIQNSSDFNRLQQVANICGDLAFELMGTSKLGKKVWRLTLRLLAHRFPKLRVYTSERLYAGYQVSIAPDDLEEFHEQVGSLLLDQDFQQPLPKLFDQLKFVYDQFNVPMPKPKSKPN